MFSFVFARGVVKNPELGKTSNGTPVINFELIVDRADSVGKIYVNRFRVSAFGPGVWDLRAWDGKTVFLLGRLQSEKWEDAEGRIRSAVKIVLIDGWLVDSNQPVRSFHSRHYRSPRT